MIRVEHVWKSYSLANGSRHQVFEDLSLTLPAKTNIGVVGRNGAGKSTLIRLLAGIERPERGRVVADGLVSPPLGLQSGITPNLTGRENARFVCRVKGDSPQTMARRIDYIQAFADVGNFFDEPLRNYSAGMRARVAFAISMAFDYDYYLIDELTSVGDEGFRHRADAAFDSKRERASIVLVSHSLASLRHWCQAGLYVKNGRVTYFDLIADAIKAYQRDNK